MTSKRFLEKSLVGTRVCSAPGEAGNIRHAGSIIGHGEGVTAMECGVILECKNGPIIGKVFNTKHLDAGTLREWPSKDVSGVDLTSGREKICHPKKVPNGGVYDENKMAPGGVLKRLSPTRCLIINGQRLDDQTYAEPRQQARRAEDTRSYLASHGADPPLQENGPLVSSHIPVPRNRKPSGHADKEVMAATVLTSLSTSPLVLNPSSAGLGAVSEPASRGWKESLSTSYSSSTSGNWSWDASDQSVPSTPSPPLTNDASKSFLLSSQGEDNIEEPESTHFLFEDPIPRKRKNSMKVMFKCLWKNCEKVLSTSSGIQRHIRTVHLGRNGDSDYSDGEEDFYYSEIEVNMDSLSEGLSNLTPTSPTTAGQPPLFPPANDMSRPEQSHAIHTPLSQSAPSTLCHIRTDHAYQATAPVNIPMSSELSPSQQSGISVSWQSPPIIFKGIPGPMTHIRTVSIGEKRQPVQHTTTSKSHTANTATPKPSTGSRKPRGEAKKCRKVYGMEKKDLWCTACRWKKLASASLTEPILFLGAR